MCPSPSFSNCMANPISLAPHASNPRGSIALLQIFQKISLVDKETLEVYSLIAVTYFKEG